MFQVLALLYQRESDVQAFRAFEQDAIAIIRDHGGKLITAFVPESKEGEETPDEIHLIQFPDKPAFHAYQADPRTMALSSRRANVIAKTIVYASDEIVQYD